MKRRVILLGPPASGKGTIAASLEARFGLCHLSSGQILRQEIDQRSLLGQRAKLFIEKGQLVPDETVIKLVARRLESNCLGSGFVLDGFPRNLMQAMALDKWLRGRHSPVQAVVRFDLPEPLLRERIQGRRTCIRCGRVYHIASLPPRQRGRCDFCGGTLEKREDDTVAVLEQRLEVYRRETEPVISYYSQQQIVTTIDASQSVNEMDAATSAALQ